MGFGWPQSKKKKIKTLNFERFAILEVYNPRKECAKI